MRSSRKARYRVGAVRTGPARLNGQHRHQPDGARELQERLRELNLRILRWADDPQAPADLVCECVDPQCFSVVTTTPATFRELQAHGDFVVSPGHDAGLRPRLPAVA